MVHGVSAGYRRIAYDPLHAFARAAIEACGVSAADAQLVADVLVASDMRGIESHGVARLERFYVDRLREGLIDPKAVATVERETATSLAYDAHNGLGHPVSVRAMAHAIEKAKTSGVCFATVKNSNHYGMAGYYATMALEDGMIGISLTNTLRYSPPTYGREVMLGTNPIAVAVPAGEEDAFVLDMATTTVALGKLEIAGRKSQKLKMGWAIDSEGNPTDDPAKGMLGGLLPLGGYGVDNGGHKGYGLGALVDILCGVLAGGTFGRQHPALGEFLRPNDTGHFFGAMRIELFRDLEAFKRDLDRELRTFNQSAPAPGQSRVYVAGEIEWEKARAHAAGGIPLDPVIWESLRRTAAKLNLPPPVGIDP